MSLVQGLGAFAAPDDEAVAAWCYFADRPWYGETWLPWLRHAKDVALGALDLWWLVMLGKPTECEPIPNRSLRSCCAGPVLALQTDLLRGCSRGEIERAKGRRRQPA